MYAVYHSLRPGVHRARAPTSAMVQGSLSCWKAIIKDTNPVDHLNTEVCNIHPIFRKLVGHAQQADLRRNLQLVILQIFYACRVGRAIVHRACSSSTGQAHRNSLQRTAETGRTPLRPTNRWKG